MVKARHVKKENAKKKQEKSWNLSVMLLSKLNDNDLREFYYLKVNDKEKFKKKYHGYVLGKKIDLYNPDDKTTLYDVNEIYRRYNRDDKVITVKADNRIIEFRKKRVYKDEVEPFRYALKCIKTDEDMKTFIDLVCDSRGIDLIIFGDITEDVNHQGTDPEHISFHDSLSNEKIFLKYIDYDVNHDSEIFKDLFVTKDKYDDYKENSCFLNLIVSTYRDKFPSGRYKPLTFDSLCNILHTENIEQNIGLTVKQSVSFFQKYRLGFFLLDRK